MFDLGEYIKSLDKDIRECSEGIDKEQALLRLKEIAIRYEGQDEIIQTPQIVERILKEKNRTVIKSGYIGLDAILGGFTEQQLIVVSALTKSGKTSFLMDMTAKLKEYAPLWFPFEESADELINKFLERKEEPPLLCVPKTLTESTIEWIEKKILESIAKYNTKIVFIDQLDFVVPMNSDNHALRVGQTMRELKGLAKKWNIVIFLVCHLVKAKMDTQPTLEDLKGSSSIAQEADTVMLLWRQVLREDGEIKITNNVNLSVQANRRTGRTGNVKMVYVNGHFLERDWRSEDEIQFANL